MQLLGDRLGAIKRTVLDQHDEFVAGQARQVGAVLQLRLEQLGDLAQQFIASGMAAGVVDHLEQVEVEVAQRVHRAAFAGAIKRLLQVLFELAPVEQTRERVVRRLVGDFAPERAHLGDVAEYQHGAENVALGTTNRRGRELDRVLVAVSAGEHDIGAGGDDLASRQRARHRVMHRLACRVMYDFENLGKPPIAGLLRGPAGQPFGHRVQIFHAPGAVGADDAVAHGL